MTPAPNLYDSRIRLRPPQPSDGPFFIELYGDKEVMRHIPPFNTHLTPEDALKRLQVLLNHWKLRNYGMFVVEDRKSGEPMGYCGLRYLKEVDAIELGSIFGKRSWGRGIGPDAAKLCMEYAKEALDVESMVSLTRPENNRSQKVLERLGFEHCPELDDTYHGCNHLFYLIHF